MLTGVPRLLHKQLAGAWERKFPIILYNAADEMVKLTIALANSAQYHNTPSSKWALLGAAQ